MNLKMEYRAHFVIGIEMVGTIGTKLADLSNPNSSPAFWVDFKKNKDINRGKYLIKNGEMIGFYTIRGHTIMQPGWHKLSDEEILAAKTSINEYLINGTEVIYLNEHGVMKDFGEKL